MPRGFMASSPMVPRSGPSHFSERKSMEFDLTKLKELRESHEKASIANDNSRRAYCAARAALEDELERLAVLGYRSPLPLTMVKARS